MRPEFSLFLVFLLIPPSHGFPPLPSTNVFLRSTPSYRSRSFTTASAVSSSTRQRQNTQLKSPFFPIIGDGVEGEGKDIDEETSSLQQSLNNNNLLIPAAAAVVSLPSLLNILRTTPSLSMNSYPSPQAMSLAIFFVVGYTLITFEDEFEVDEAAVALFMSMVLWCAYACSYDAVQPDAIQHAVSFLSDFKGVASELLSKFSEVSESCFVLLSATTSAIVEVSNPSSIYTQDDKLVPVVLVAQIIALCKGTSTSTSTGYCGDLSSIGSMAMSNGFTPLNAVEDVSFMRWYVENFSVGAAAAVGYFAGISGYLVQRGVLDDLGVVNDSGVMDVVNIAEVGESVNGIAGTNDALDRRKTLNDIFNYNVLKDAPLPTVSVSALLEISNVLDFTSIVIDDVINGVKGVEHAVYSLIHKVEGIVGGLNGAGGWSPWRIINYHSSLIDGIE